MLHSLIKSIEALNKRVDAVSAHQSSEFQQSRLDILTSKI
jgi:hypothetical protein